MITGSLQKKKGLYYAVLNLYDEYGKRKPKWIPTGYTIKGNKKKAKEKLEQFKIEYEKKSKIQLRDPNIYDKYKNILFCDYMIDWLEKQKGKVEQTTYIGYEQVIKIRTTTIELPVLIAGVYGLRREEVLGIKWSAIDFNLKTLTIRHTVGRGKVDGVTKFIFKDRVKSDSGYRTLPLFDFIADKLNEYKNKYSENKKIYGNTYCNKYKDYVCLMENGELMKPGYLTQTFSKILDDNNLRHIRLHDLRHSCGTLLIQNGVPVKDIQIWLGHSNFQTTLRYTHADVENKKISASVINNKLLFNTNNTKKEQLTELVL